MSVSLLSGKHSSTASRTGAYMLNHCCGSKIINKKKVLDVNFNVFYKMCTRKFVNARILQN